MDDHKSRLESLRSDLFGYAIGNLARRSASTDTGGMNCYILWYSSHLLILSLYTPVLHSVLPPPPTELFTGRDDYLDTMERSFEVAKAPTGIKTQWMFILYGTGGMGKTQLALQFLRRNSDK